MGSIWVFDLQDLSWFWFPKQSYSFLSTSEAFVN